MRRESKLVKILQLVHGMWMRLSVKKHDDDINRDGAAMLGSLLGMLKCLP
jgi:hypothetical protein